MNELSPFEALTRIAYLLEQELAPTHRVQAFRKAADVVAGLSAEELRALAGRGQLRQLAGIGPTTEQVITEALAGRNPAYLSEVAERVKPAPLNGAAADLRASLQGDCHGHSDWSDGGAPIEAMARAARSLGHSYWSLTDHSPRLTVAHGLDERRLREQLEVVAQLNSAFAREGPSFRILTGIEVDILEDGSLDQDEEMLAELDVVVASAHSKLRMDGPEMTRRLISAVSSPHVDILGHCTGRKLVGRGRPESTFDAEQVFAVCKATDTAVEVNCRPERLDPPMRLLQLAVDMDCRLAIDTDAHAPGQLEWQSNGCPRVARCGTPPSQVVNTWPAEELLLWTAGHAA